MQTFTGQGRGFTPAAWDTQENLPGGRLALAGGRQPQPALAPGHLWPGRPRWPKRWPPSTGINLSPPRQPGLAPPRPRGTIGSGSPQPFPWTTSSAQCQQDGAFSRPLRQPSASAVQAGGERFVWEMLALSLEEATLTVTHGDLQTICGDHVRRFRDRPMVHRLGALPSGRPFISIWWIFSPARSPLLYWEAPAPPGEHPQPGQLPGALAGCLRLPRASSTCTPALMQYLRGDDSRLEKLINLLLAG